MIRSSGYRLHDVNTAVVRLQALVSAGDNYKEREGETVIPHRSSDNITEPLDSGLAAVHLTTPLFGAPSKKP